MHVDNGLTSNIQRLEEWETGLTTETVIQREIIMNLTFTLTELNVVETRATKSWKPENIPTTKEIKNENYSDTLYRNQL